MAMYYLVDNYTDDIIDKIDSVTPGGAEHYFIGIAFSHPPHSLKL